MGAKQGIIQKPTVRKLNYSDVLDLNMQNQICQRPPPFCCCFNPQNKSIMPIQKLNYQVNVNLGFFTVTMLQTYENNLEKPTDLEYVFITNNNATFIKLEVELGEQLIGLIREKQEASSDYLNGMQKGNTLLYSYKDNGYPDIMRVKFGNLIPKSNLIVSYQYIQLLDVTVNEFWRIEIEQAVHPSYLAEPQKQQFIDFGSFKQNFLQDINITFDLPTPITFCQSPTHIIQRRQEGQLKHIKDLIILDPDFEENFKSNKRFILLFSNKEVHQPMICLSYSDRDELKQEQYCATTAFIPQFNPLEKMMPITHIQTNMIQIHKNLIINQKENIYFYLIGVGLWGEGQLKKQKRLLIYLSKDYIRIVTSIQYIFFFLEAYLKYYGQNLENTVYIAHKKHQRQLIILKPIQMEQIYQTLCNIFTNNKDKMATHQIYIYINRWKSDTRTSNRLSKIIFQTIYKVVLLRYRQRLQQMSCRKGCFSGQWQISSRL